MAMEVGKNRMEALGDVAETADLIRYACYQMEKNDGYMVEMGRDPLVGYTATNYSVLRPYGVWLVISPFNFPTALTGGPAGAALVTGNTRRHETRHGHPLDGAPVWQNACGMPDCRTVSLITSPAPGAHSGRR